jgi:hypothetical protein
MMVNWFAVALGTNIKAKRQSSLICCESRLTDDIYYMNRINFLHVFGYFRICEPLMMISLRFCYSFPLHSFILFEVVFSFSSFSVRFRSGIYVSFVFKPTNHVSQNSYLDKKTTSGCFSNIVNEEYSSS